MKDTAEIISARPVQMALAQLVGQALIDAGFTVSNAQRCQHRMLTRLESGAPYWPAVRLVAAIAAEARKP